MCRADDKPRYEDLLSWGMVNYVAWPLILDIHAARIKSLCVDGPTVPLALQIGKGDATDRLKGYAAPVGLKHTSDSYAIRSIKIGGSVGRQQAVSHKPAALQVKPGNVPRSGPAASIGHTILDMKSHGRLVSTAYNGDSYASIEEDLIEFSPERIQSLQSTEVPQVSIDYVFLQLSSDHKKQKPSLRAIPVPDQLVRDKFIASPPPYNASPDVVRNWIGSWFAVESVRPYNVREQALNMILALPWDGAFLRHKSQFALSCLFRSSLDLYDGPHREFSHDVFEALNGKVQNFATW